MSHALGKTKSAQVDYSGSLKTMATFGEMTTRLTDSAKEELEFSLLHL